jgi:hypothetical protein
VKGLVAEKLKIAWDNLTQTERDDWCKIYILKRTIKSVSFPFAVFDLILLERRTIKIYPTIAT